MESKIKPFDTLFLMLAGILSVNTGIFWDFHQIILAIIFSILAIASYVIAGICRYYIPKNERVAPYILLGFKDRER